MRSRYPAWHFWALHCAGWAVFGAQKFYSTVPDGRRVLAFTVAAFVVSLALRDVLRRLRRRNAPLPRVCLVALAGSLVAAFAWLVVTDAVLWAARLQSYVEPTLGEYLTAVGVAIFTHNKSFVFLAWSALYLGVTYWRDAREQRERATQADQLAAEARLKMLRYQLNPHFLFNSLNSVQALIREDPERADRMIGELSDFLRSSLVSDASGATTLGEELEIIRAYLAVEAVRFEEKLRVEMVVEPEAERARVPGLLVHQLVENAVKHGMETSPLPLHIVLEARREADRLVVSVENTGRWRGDGDSPRAPRELSTGTGLANVRERLARAYGEAGRLAIAEADGLVRVTIDVPHSPPGLGARA